MQTRTIALGVAAAIAVAAAVAVTVTRHPTSKRHEAVASYIQHVNGLERTMQAKLTVASIVYRSFAMSGKIDRRSHRDLVGAARTLRVLQRRLTLLPAPEPAIRLRRLLLRLGRAHIVVADEVASMAAFVPPFARLAAQSQQLRVRLKAALAAVRTPKPHGLRGTKAQVRKAQREFAATAAAAAAQQADALDAYAAALAVLERRLRLLHPPTVLRPALSAELATVSGSRRAGARLATELRRRDRSHVAELSRHFTEAGRVAGSVRVQRAQIAAITSYNTRVQAIARLRVQIRAELARLQTHG